AQLIQPVFSHVIPGPVSPQDAVRAIGKEPLLVIPRDDAAASGAMNDGTPLNGKQSALSFAIADLAAKLTGVAPPSKPKGLLQRVFRKGAGKGGGEPASVPTPGRPPRAAASRCRAAPRTAGSRPSTEPTR